MVPGPQSATADPATGGRGSQRAVSDMPINCPCEGCRYCFFREFLVRMGMLNLHRGHVGENCSRAVDCSGQVVISAPSPRTSPRKRGSRPARISLGHLNGTGLIVDGDRARSSSKCGIAAACGHLVPGDNTASEKGTVLLCRKPRLGEGDRHIFLPQTTKNEPVPGGFCFRRLRKMSQSPAVLSPGS